MTCDKQLKKIKYVMENDKGLKQTLEKHKSDTILTLKIKIVDFL